MKNKKSNDEKQNPKQARGEQDRTDFLSDQCSVRFSDDDMKTIVSKAIGDGLVYKIISNKKEYKIYADGE